MRQLTIGATIKVNLDTLDDTVGEYEAQEVVDILTLQIQEQFYQYDLEIDVYDYLIEEEDW